jgi:hypothetical protein
MRSRALPICLFLACAGLAVAMVFFMSKRAKPIGHVALLAGLGLSLLAIAFVTRRVPPAAPRPRSVDLALLTAAVAVITIAATQLLVGIWTDAFLVPYTRVVLGLTILMTLPYALWAVIGGTAAGRMLAGYPFRTVLYLLFGLLLAAKMAPMLLKPVAGIDVWFVLTRGAENLFAGANPYSTQIPEAIRYGLEFGNPPATYVYPPAALYLTLPFVKLTPDVRLIYPLSDLCTALLIFGIGRTLGGTPRISRLSEVAALAVMVHPLGFGYVWTDLLHAPLFCLFVWLTLRGASRAAPAVLGYLLAMKQYMVFFAAPALLLLRTRRAFLIAASVGLATVLPFLVWDAQAMWHSLVTFHLRTPFRLDGMTASAILASHGDAPLPAWLGPAIAAPIVAFSAWWFRSRGLVGVCVSSAAALACLFFFSQYAFSNYYHFVTVLLLLGALLAVAELEREPKA